MSMNMAREQMTGKAYRWIDIDIDRPPKGYGMNAQPSQKQYTHWLKITLNATIPKPNS